MANEVQGFPITHPHLLEQWDWELNEGIDPYTISAGKADKYYWKCLNDERHPSFLAAVNKRTRKLSNDKNHGCPVCANRKVIEGINDLKSQFPDIADEWDYEANAELGAEPSEIPFGTNRKASWKCSKCGYQWTAAVIDRTKAGHGCPVCSNRVIVPGMNDMFTLHPELVAMLHPTLNGDFDPHSSASTVNKKLWWQCSENKEHVFDATPGNILMGRGCPYCSNKRVKSGINDIQSQYPKLMKEWDWEANTLDPSTLSYGSKQIAHWKCKYGHKWTAPITQRTTNHTGCPKCNCNHTSFTEYFIYFACCAVFGQDKVFHRDKRLGTEVDILVPEYGFGIEPGSWFYHKKKREQDFKKRQLCKEHGITLHIIYDDFPHIDTEAGIWIWGCYNVEGHLRDIKNEPRLIEIVRQIISNYKSIPENIPWDSIRDQANKAAHSKCLPEESLEAIRPELLDEWDYDKNMFLPNEITPYNNSIGIWWTCHAGHSYQKTTMNKTPGCDVCSERLIIPGIDHISDVIENIDDIWDTEVNLQRKLLLDNIGAEKRNHAKPISLICPHCGHHFSRTLSVLLHGKRANHNQCPECGGTIAKFKKPDNNINRASDNKNGQS